MVAGTTASFFSAGVATFFLVAGAAALFLTAGTTASFISAEAAAFFFAAGIFFSVAVTLPSDVAVFFFTGTIIVFLFVIFYKFTAILRPITKLLIWHTI